MRACPGKEGRWYLSLCDKDRGNPGYFEQAPVDDDGRGSNGDRETDLILCSCARRLFSRRADKQTGRRVDETTDICRTRVEKDCGRDRAR